ncbi:16483_t:CDS:1, partial [Gigaspora rosea]
FTKLMEKIQKKFSFTLSNLAMASENTEEILEFFFCLPHECWSPECFITHLVTQNKFSKKDELFRKYYSDLRQISIDERFSPDARQCAKDIFGKKDVSLI